MKLKTKRIYLLLSVFFLSTSISCGNNVTPTIDLCEPLLREFLETSDSNKEYEILANNAHLALGSQHMNIEIPENIYNCFIYYDTDPNFSNPYFYAPEYGDNTLAVPGNKYYYRIYSLRGEDETRLISYDIDYIKSMPTHSELIKEGSFYTKTGGVRFCNIKGLDNFRDLGGWKTSSGKTVKYNMLYRGPEIDTAQKIAENQLKGQLNIKTEIDLRHGTSLQRSCFAPQFLYAGINQYDLIDPKNPKFNDYNIQSFKDIFSFLGKEENYPIYYHCAVGCDRTGTLSLLINGALGVSLQDLTKDFELSSFSSKGYRCRGPLTLPYEYGLYQDDKYNYVNWGGLVDSIKSVDTSKSLSFQECVIKFLIDKFSVSKLDIESMQRIMLGD